MITTESKERYLAAYQQAKPHLAKRAPAWLSELREAGIANFDQLGFPTTRIEEWRYTNVEPIAVQSFARANGEAQRVSAREVVARSMIDPAAARLVFVNGIYTEEFSQTAMLERGVVVKSLASFIKEDDATAASRLGHYASGRRQPFVALNTAFLEDGALVSIAAGCRADRPIYLVFVSTAANEPVVSHPRTLILLGAGSEAKIVESYLGLDGGYFCNAVTELAGAPDSVIEHYRLQQESDAGFHVGTLEARLDRGCHLTAHAVSLAGALVRNNVRVTLNGEGAECVLNGLYLADGKQHIDNFTEIEHVKPRARSLELYKGILGGSAHGVFNGRIVVHKDAQKTDARQTNKNLLLSADAVVNTQPQLEIYADDVKCSHGSTIGQMDGDALFYLRSRGLGVEEARSLLSFAFASDVVGRMKIDFLRARLDDYLVARFGRQ
ncbi:MAG: Iron-regulated transporter permease protein SufD [Deltaproteobacteria bacterium]|nr:Iron-regulated transporter permease protein SufD [Deltaproteobacteria bacterium]